MTTPVVVETAAVRCAKVDPRLKEEFSDQALDKALTRPVPRLCPDGKLAVCDSDARQWIDGLEASVFAKHKAGNILIKDSEACRSGAPPKGKRAKTS